MQLEPIFENFLLPFDDVRTSVTWPDHLNGSLSIFTGCCHWSPFLQQKLNDFRICAPVGCGVKRCVPTWIGSGQQSLVLYLNSNKFQICVAFSSFVQAQTFNGTAKQCSIRFTCRYLRTRPNNAELWTPADLAALLIGREFVAQKKSLKNIFNFGAYMKWRVL